MSRDWEAGLGPGSPCGRPTPPMRCPRHPRSSPTISFSAVHLVLAAVLLKLRPRDWTARLLATALVGAAGVFNLTSQAVLEQLPYTPIETWGRWRHMWWPAWPTSTRSCSFPMAARSPAGGRRGRIPLPHRDGWSGFPLDPSGGTGPARHPLVVLRSPGADRRGGRTGLPHRQNRGCHRPGPGPPSLLGPPALGRFRDRLPRRIHGLSPATNVFAGRHIPEPPVALYRTFQPAFALIPLALFTGILRYRLWDIERLLNRTTVYAIATGMLGSVYTAFIVVAQLLLGTVAASPSDRLQSRRSPSPPLVFLTAFRPVRDEVQKFIDRRFNRSRYDAQVTMERFAEELRHEVDLNDIVGRLDDVLTEVIQPRHVSVWLIDTKAESRVRELRRS